jgi:predicted transcriptional regulator
MKVATDTHILTALLDRGPMTCKALREQVLRHNSVVHRSLVGMEQIGMVERQHIGGHVPDLWSVGRRIRLGVLRDMKPRVEE